MKLIDKDALVKHFEEECIGSCIICEFNDEENKSCRIVREAEEPKPKNNIEKLIRDCTPEELARLFIPASCLSCPCQEVCDDDEETPCSEIFWRWASMEVEDD